MSTPGKSIVRVGILAAFVIAGGWGCEASYNQLRFRPVDTTSQLTLEGVKVVSGGVQRGVTDEHGQVDVRGVRAGEVLRFEKPGYEPATIRFGMGQYIQKSPETQKDEMRMDLRDLDVVPIPLHRTGSIRRPGSGVEAGRIAR